MSVDQRRAEISVSGPSGLLLTQKPTSFLSMTDGKGPLFGAGLRYDAKPLVGRN